MLDATNLWDLIGKRAEATPDARMAVDEGGRQLTFSGYRDACERAAAGLAERGVGKGSVVSWELPTWIESLVLVGALSRLGATQNPIIPIYREREVGFIARQASPSLLVVPSEFRGFDYAGMAKGIADEVGGIDVLVCDRDLPEGDPSGLDAPPSGNDVRWLFYTSGTTADPKGARHTDSNIIVTARGMCERIDARPDDVNALVFPFTHIGGIIWLASSLLVGFPNVCVATFNPPETIPLLHELGVTIAGAGTPFHMAYLKAQREQPDTPVFPDVRCFPGGGAPKPPQLHHDVKREIGGAGIVSGYGLTEAPILTMAGVDDPDDKLANTEGRPMPGVSLRLVDLDGNEADEGEVRAKAPQVMKGYLDTSLDDEAFDEDGWFRTGDLGRLDDGYLVITGRLKDVIIRKGETISAKDVEDLLFDHPKVSDVAVVGLPDPEAGERVCAVVVPDGDAPTLDELTAYLGEQGLAKQKWPERLEIADALPRNPTGKVLKYELRDRYA